MVPPPSQNIAGVCNQISLLILYYISSILVTLFKVIVAHIQVPNIFDFILSSSSSILTLKYSFFLFLKFLLASHLTLFVLSTLLWLGFYTLLFCFLWCKKPKHSSSNCSLWCFNSCRFRPSLAEVLIFSLMFSQALFMSSLSYFFQSCSVFIISVWYCFITFSSFSFLRLNLFPSNFCASFLHTANLSLTFATTR